MAIFILCPTLHKFYKHCLQCVDLRVRKNGVPVEHMKQKRSCNHGNCTRIQHEGLVVTTGTTKFALFKPVAMAESAHFVQIRSLLLLQLVQRIAQFIFVTGLHQAKSGQVRFFIQQVFS